MRLIDADALKKEIVKRTPHFIQRIAFTPCFDAIRNAPTVDAVPVSEYRQVQFFNAEKIFDVFFPIKLNLDIVNRIQIGDEKFVSVVRCHECIQSEPCLKKNSVYCNKLHDAVMRNWYCADGEKRKE